jgi:general secretion pathway protein F
MTPTSTAEPHQVRFLVRSMPPGAAAVTEAQIDAGSVAEARSRVAAQGHAVLSVRATQLAASAPRFDVAWWCRELRTLLRSGMTVVEAIEALAAGKHDPARDRVHAGLVAALMQGQSLSRAMTTVGGFPQVLVAGVIASERTSTLVDALDDYLRYEDMVERLRRQAVSAAIYPAVVIGLGVAITQFLLLFVIPRFSRMYADRQSGLSTATEMVLWLSRLLQQHLAWIVVAMVLLGVLLVVAIREGWLVRMFTAVSESNAELRTQIDHFRLAKLYQSLALMVRGGYTVDEALGVGEALDLGPRLQTSLTQTRLDIARGRNASSAFARAGLTEVVTERLLAVGERTGAFDTVLQTIADRHAERFATFVERATRIVEPLLLLIVALVVGGIVVMMYMPIFDMANSLGGAR